MSSTVCAPYGHTPLFGEAHGRSESRSHRPAIVCRSGARRDLCAVCDRPFTDFRHADRGQLCPRRVLYGWSLCRALHALARRKFLDLPDRGAAGRRLVRSRRRTHLDTAAFRGGARAPQSVRGRGVDVTRVWLIVFGIGTAIAGFAGLLAAPLQGVIPEMGGTFLAEGFVVTVVGGGGSLGGSVRSSGRRGREHDVAVCAGDGEGVDIRADGGCSDRPAARVLRPRWIDELKMKIRA